MSLRKLKPVYFNNTQYNLVIKNSQIENAGLGLFLDIKAKPILKNALLGYYFGYWIFLGYLLWISDLDLSGYLWILSG